MREFDELGYAEHSVTKVIDNLKLATEISLEADNSTVFTLEEQLNKIDLSHLKPEHRDLARNLFKNYGTVILRSMWQIPACNLYEAQLVLKPDALKT